MWSCRLCLPFNTRGIRAGWISDTCMEKKILYSVHFFGLFFLAFSSAEASWSLASSLLLSETRDRGGEKEKEISRKKMEKRRGERVRNIFTGPPFFSTLLTRRDFESYERNKFRLKTCIRHVIRLPYINVAFFALGNDQKSRRVTSSHRHLFFFSLIDHVLFCFPRKNFLHYPKALCLSRRGGGGQEEEKCAVCCSLDSGGKGMQEEGI